MKTGNYEIMDEFHLSKNNDTYKDFTYIRDIPSLPFKNWFIDRTIIDMAADPGFHCCKKEGCSKRENFLPPFNDYPTTDCKEKRGRHPIIKTLFFDSHLYLLEKN